MSKKNYKWVVYFITLTVVVTIAVQVYWNYREYKINKHRLISNVQRSLDNAVETYFANLTKSGIITFTSQSSKSAKPITDTILVQTKSRWDFRKKIDSTLHNIAKIEGQKPLVIKNERGNNFPFFVPDSILPKNLDNLISKVFISISRDTLDLLKLNSYLKEELARNNISVKYGLQYTYYFHYSRDSIAAKTIKLNLNNFPKKYLITTSKSTFLPHRSQLELLFTNETALLLKNSIISILLSFLLSLSIIASLLYLLKTIYKQKQLAEVKTDFINNVTHEFKTPIATISAALEAIKNFNVIDDKAKTENYIGIANNQLEKLTIMVEKILETSTLNHEDLILQKEPIIINEFLENIVEKFRFIALDKSFIFNSSATKIVLNLDKFHFENAIGNLIDNAIKYGGNTITISIIKTTKKVIIEIKDNGNGIPKAQREKVFEQFYRIPTGDQHNVKGFGIGLFYTKKIIEKHQGTIAVVYDKKQSTIFKIELQNA